MLRLTWLLVSMVPVGCDNPPADPDAGVSRDASSADAGERRDAATSDSSTADASTGDASTGDASTGDAGAGLRQATVSLYQNRTGTPAAHGVYGGFFPDLIAPPIADEGVVPCAASATAGSCGLYRCTTLGARATAGTLTVEVEGTDIANITTPGPSGDYGVFANGIVAEPGDVVTFRATGDEVPAFSGMVVTPGAITATLPSTVPRDEPLTISWSVSGAERLHVTIAAGTGAIACIVDAKDGSVVVAPELLGMLPAGSGAVALSAFNFVGVTAGEYRVLLTAADATSGVVPLE